MKKIILLILAIFGNLSVFAYDFEVDGIYYNITSSTNLTVEVTFKTTSHNSYSNSVTIPFSVTYNNISYSVTSIGYMAFYDCSSLTSISIPSSITSISGYAFYKCNLLISIGIPSSVISIGEDAFSYCTSLTNISIPASVTSINYDAFYSCTGLKSISIPSSITSISSNTFAYCSSLTSIDIPSSVTDIGSGAFWGCTSLLSVNIPISVVTIGSYTFYGCTGLTSLNIPTSVSSIDNYTFKYCTSLSSISIPSSITSIGIGAYSDCTGLTTISIPSSVTNINNMAFFNCTNLNSIYVYHTKPLTLTNISIFQNVSKSTCVLYVPYGTSSLYAATTVWQDFIHISEMSVDVKTILENNTLNIYPNPVTDAFYVNGFKGNASVSVYSLNGKLLLSQKTAADVAIALDNLKSGVYMVKIKTQTSEACKKLIKQ